jgi:hypothetical protein
MDDERRRVKERSAWFLELLGLRGYRQAMRRTFGRLLFAVFAAGQLQLIPAALACAREHRQPTAASHCAAPAAAPGAASLAPVPGIPNPLCPLLGPCASPAPAVAARAASAHVRVVDGAAAVPGRPVRPASFDLTPPAPPPEA